MEKTGIYLKQKVPLPNKQLIELLKECTKIVNPQLKGRKFEQAIGLCFISAGNYHALKVKNKDIFVFVKPGTILFDHVNKIVVECKNTDQEITSDQISSLANKLDKYNFFGGALGVMIHRSSLQKGAIRNLGSKPIIVITLNELLKYLKDGKKIDDLIYEKIPSI